MTEQPAADLRQRQYAEDMPVLFDKKEPGAMAEYALDDGLPACLVEKSGLRAGVDERIPAQIVAALEKTQCGCRGGGVGNDAHARSRKMRSIRSQVKSRARSRSRPSMRDMLT